ncbi:MAG TPA: PH domain-containing protein [Chloroflexia bacterium]|nr:PH domain-containing protein [Chloroflexia bacterium]
MSQTFKPAPPGAVAIIWTLGFIGGFAFFAVRIVLAASAGVSPDLYDVGGAFILLICIIYGWARSAKSYRVSEGELNIDRAAMKGVSVPLEMVKSAESKPDIGSFFNMSMLSSGGLFGWGGRANVRKPMDINSMVAYVYGANPKNSVLFSIEGGKNIIVTPADPQGFLAAIRKASVRPPTAPATNPPKKKRKH